MKPKRKVVLTGLPQGFTDDLPVEDQQALLDAVGAQIALTGYNENGRAELEFKDKKGVWHFIYLEPKLNLFDRIDSTDDVFLPTTNDQRPTMISRKGN